ncbi:hypothetical protein SBOR_7829 [Sclerotinia borealis F-4128]|uniref:CCHC-type domain-containing protein n=1 Tax=Sclerotinia borealis (strain F-4128) TaxID=1432307 RepID=W9C7H9_SCLBF|nr:hypothetical protein SBOR_7829 [Sclerotinia borealis F-4128]
MDRVILDVNDSNARAGINQNLTKRYIGAIEVYWHGAQPVFFGDLTGEALQAKMNVSRVLVYPNEQKKLFHMISLMNGAVRRERTLDVQNILDGTSPYLTANAFLAKLDNLYISVDIEREAAIKFDNHKMTEKMNFQSFYTMLEYLGDLCHKTKRDMVQAMKLKVTDDLKAMVKQDANPCTPAPPAAGDPMDLHAINANARKQTNKEQERHLGLCHYCKEPGHRVWDCTTKKQADILRNSYNAANAPKVCNPNWFGERPQGFQPRPQNPLARGGFQAGGSQTGYEGSQGRPPQNNGYFGQRNYNQFPNSQNQGFPRLYQLNNVQGYVEEESLAPSDSGSNATSRTTSSSGFFPEQGNA